MRRPARRRSVGLKEHAIQKAILQTCQRPHIALFRQNVGTFFPEGKGGKKYRVDAGLCVGSSDIIGWKTEDVFIALELDEMWATTSARFVAIEAKREGWKPPKPSKTKSGMEKYQHHLEQKAFLDRVTEAGGIAGFVTSVEEAMKLLGLDRR